MIRAIFSRIALFNYNAAMNKSINAIATLVDLQPIYLHENWGCK
jgi:hypothetical protein